MAEPQKKNREPVAQDRYWRLPVYNSELDPDTLGQYMSINTQEPLGQQLAALKGAPELIEINQTLPQTVAGEGENLRQTTMKHELAHVLQGRMRGKGGISPNFKAPLPNAGDGVLGWFLSQLKDPSAAKAAALDYQRQLDQSIGPHESDAFLLSDTTRSIQGAPQNREQQKVLQQMQIEELERKGQAKYTPIWKK